MQQQTETALEENIFKKTFHSLWHFVRTPLETRTPLALWLTC